MIDYYCNWARTTAKINEKDLTSTDNKIINFLSLKMLDINEKLKKNPLLFSELGSPSSAKKTVISYFDLPEYTDITSFLDDNGKRFIKFCIKCETTSEGVELMKYSSFIILYCFCHSTGSREKYTRLTNIYIPREYQMIRTDIFCYNSTIFDKKIHSPLDIIKEIITMPIKLFPYVEKVISFRKEGKEKELFLEYTGFEYSHKDYGLNDTSYKGKVLTVLQSERGLSIEDAYLIYLSMKIYTYGFERNPELEEAIKSSMGGRNYLKLTEFDFADKLEHFRLLYIGNSPVFNEKLERAEDELIKQISFIRESVSSYYGIDAKKINIQVNNKTL